MYLTVLICNFLTKCERAVGLSLYKLSCFSSVPRVSRDIDFCKRVRRVFLRHFLSYILKLEVDNTSTDFISDR